jgi:hypothetical protein
MAIGQEGALVGKGALGDPRMQGDAGPFQERGQPRETQRPPKKGGDPGGVQRPSIEGGGSHTNGTGWQLGEYTWKAD